MRPGPRERARLGLAAALLASACGARAPASETESWTERSTEERSSAMYRELGVAPRLLHLDRAVVRFVDLAPRGPRRGPGPRPEEALVLVHGIHGSAGDFAPVVLELAGRERVVAVDLPGFGGSVRADDDYSIDAYVRFLGAFTRRLGLERVHLVCHSLGGQICLGAALHDPEWLGSLTLIDAAGIY